MRKLLLLLSLSWTLCLAKQTDLQALQDLLKHTPRLRAHFRQLTHDDAGIVLQKSHGHFSWSQPGHFFWETHAPSHQQVIADGQSLWIVDYSLKQAIHQSLNQVVIENPTQLLTEPEKLGQFFAVQQLQGQNQHFQLHPLQPQQIQRIDITFQHSKLAKFCYINSLNQTTCLKFSRLDTHPLFSPSAFKFSPPKGMDVIEQ